MFDLGRMSSSARKAASSALPFSELHGYKCVVLMQGIALVWEKIVIFAAAYRHAGARWV